MLQQMRDKAQNFKWILWAVIFSFLLGFVVLFQGGFNGYSRSGLSSTVAARVGGRRVTDQQFRSALIRQEEQLRQILGQNYKPEQFLNPGNVLDMLVERAILLEEAEHIGVQASPKEVAQEIRGINAFQDDAGKFDKTKYREYLQRSGQRPTDFEHAIADDLTVASMNRLLGAGAAVPASAVKDAWKRENETASVEYVTFPLAAHLSEVAVTDAELKAEYDAHVKDYDAGPARQIEWVKFSREDYQRGLEKEDEMRAYYEQNVGSIYTITAEQRRASVILIATPPGATDEQKAAASAKASSALARAKAGEDFAALARELSDDAATKDKGGDLGPFYQGFQEPAVDQAVFAANEGDVLGPIETSRGFEIVKVTKGAGTKARPFEEVRDLVARGLYASKAGEAQAEALKKFQDAMASHPDFAKAAEAAGVKVSEPTWITRGGTIPELSSSPMIAARAFDLEVDAVSDPVADVGGQIIFKVTGEREDSPKTFEEARADVETKLKESKARELARKDAEAFRQAASAVATLGEAPGGHAVQTANDVRRGRAVQPLGSAPDFVAVAFETPVGQVGRVADVPDGAAVLRVISRTEFEDAKFEADRDALAKRLEQQQASTLRSAALDRLKAKYEAEGRIKRNESLIAQYTPQQQQGS